jgi:hypothetical protein
MTRPNRLSLKLLVALTLSSLPSQPSPAAEVAVLPGNAAQTQSKMVCSRINWLTSLEEAKQKARRENKLIVWIHMLGNIDGFT